MTGRSKPSADFLEEEPDQIVHRAGDVGEERLERTALDILITSAIGGIEVSLGGLAAMSVVGGALRAAPQIDFYGALALGGLVFPIGFLFVIVGRSELFTENFLIPVVAVFNKQSPVASLLQLWGLSWVGNVLAGAALASLLLLPDAIGRPILDGYVAYAGYKLGVGPMGVFASAMVAGVVMTVLTWALLAIEDAVGRMLAIFAAGYVLFAANLSHTIVGASLLFVGFSAAHHTLLDVAGWLLISTAGNLIGGLAFVTLFRIVQAKQKKSRARR